MFNTIKKWFTPAVSGTAHRGANPVFITDVYLGEDGWMFSWTKADNSDGGIVGPMYHQSDALVIREDFIAKQDYKHHAQFIHRGVARATAGR